MKESSKHNENILEVRDLKTYFNVGEGKVVKAVEGVNFSLKRSKILGIIGESGSGKSVTSRSIMRIVDQPGYIAGGEIIFEGQNLLEIPEREMEKIRGQKISLIFQNPTTSFNPFMTMEQHLKEVYLTHKKGATKSEARKRALEVLEMVGIHNGAEILKKYPCEFSAGFRQRVFIAMSMILEPDLLIADEPTTSLGITLQAEIMEALCEAQRKTGISIIIITHDFGVVSQFSDSLFVMYAGKCVESSPKKDLLLKPKHPYTIGLIRSVPLLEERKSKRLKSIPGFPPNMAEEQIGCSFSPRCEFAREKCFKDTPELKKVGEEHFCACHYPVDYNVEDDTKLEG